MEWCRIGVRCDSDDDRRVAIQKEMEMISSNLPEPQQSKGSLIKVIMGSCHMTSSCLGLHAIEY